MSCAVLGGRVAWRGAGSCSKPHSKSELEQKPPPASPCPSFLSRACRHWLRVLYTNLISERSAGAEGGIRFVVQTGGLSTGRDWCSARDRAVCFHLPRYPTVHPCAISTAWHILLPPLTSGWAHTGPGVCSPFWLPGAAGLGPYEGLAGSRCSESVGQGLGCFLWPQGLCGALHVCDWLAFLMPMAQCSVCIKRCFIYDDGYTETALPPEPWCLGVDFWAVF